MLRRSVGLQDTQEGFQKQTAIEAGFLEFDFFKGFLKHW